MKRRELDDFVQTQSFKKLKTVCEGIGAEQGYMLVLEVSQGGVVYSGSAVDITDELIKRYDAGAELERPHHPG